MTNRYRSNWEEQNLRKNTMIIIAVSALALIMILVFFASISVFITRHEGMTDSTPRNIELPGASAAEAPRTGHQNGNTSEPQEPVQDNSQHMAQQESSFKNHFYIRQESKPQQSVPDWEDPQPLFPDPDNIRYHSCPIRSMD